MLNHKFNLKSKGWSIIKSQNVNDIELLSKNFLQELKKNKKLNLFITKNVKSINSLRKIVSKLDDNILNLIRRLYLNKFSTNILKAFSQDLIPIFGKKLLVQKYPQIQIHVGFKNSTKTFPHYEMMAGHSPFTYNIWLPFHDIIDKSGIFLIDDKLSVNLCDKEIKNNINNREKFLFNKMFFPKIKFGEALVFNPFVYHGSIHHKNKSSRISLDVRLQRLDRPLFQKYNDFFTTLNL